MSLNKLTDSTVEKKWMNINCNSVKCESFTSSSQPYNELQLSTPLSIPNNTATIVSALNTTIRDVGGSVTYNASSGIYTVVNTGVYNVNYNLQWATGSAGAANFLCRIIVVGVRSYGLQGGGSDLSVTNSYNGVGTMYLTAGQTFNITVLQNSGGALNLANCNVVVNQVS